jgi:hypothetical protein
MHFTFCDPADICQDLENFTVSNITPTQATASWTSQGVANRWQLRYQVEPTAANGERSMAICKRISRYQLHDDQLNRVE